jgi:hypothetical protein
MIAQKRNKEFGRAVLKEKTKIAIAPTLEKLVAQLPNTETRVDMRLAETVS